MSRRLAVSLTLLLSLVVTAIGYYYYRPVDSFDIRVFRGEAKSIKNKTIILNGNFFSSDKAIPEALSTKQDFSFRVDDSTQFEKLETFWPKWEKLASGGATSGKLKLEDLPKNQGAASLDQLKEAFSLNPESLYVEAKFADSIYGVRNPIAASVYYEVIVMPAPVPLNE